MDIKKMYYQQFNELPHYLPMMANYDDEIFQNLMLVAISRNQPLTDDEIDEAYKGKVDKVIKSEDDKDMDYEKIYNLLLKYGASKEEAENFINDLKELPDEAKEELFDEDYNFENWRD